MQILPLLQSLNDVEVTEMPSESVPEDAKVVGTLPKDLQRLKQLTLDLIVETNAMVDLVDADNLDEELNRGIQSRKQVIEILLELFWFDVRAIFNHPGRTIGIAENWQVYVGSEVQCDCPTCVVMRALSQMHGVTVIEIPLL